MMSISSAAFDEQMTVAPGPSVTDQPCGRHKEVPVITHSRDGVVVQAGTFGDGIPLDAIEIHEGAMPAEKALLVQQLETSSAPSAFQVSAWHELCHRLENERLSAVPVHVIGFASGRVVIYFSLTRQSVLGRCYLRWSSHQLSDYCMPVVHQSCSAVINADHVEKMLVKVCRVMGCIDFVYLKKQPLTIADTDNPCNTPASLPYHHGAYASALSDTWEHYYHAKRSAKTRRRIKEKYAALRKHGEVTYRLLACPREAATVVERCLAMKSDQLKKLGFHDPFSTAEVRTALADYFGSRIAAGTWVAGLYLGQTLVAAAFGFRRNSVWFLYQLSMLDDEYAKHSPGNHLVMHLLQEAISAGYKTFDFGLGDESYKRDWCEVTTPLRTTIIPVTFAGHISRTMLVADAKLKSWMTHGTALHAVAKRAQKLLRGLKIPA